MILLRRAGFVAALRDGILWYSSQDEHGTAAAERLAARFAGAVDLALGKIAQRPDSGVIWPHRPGYRFRLVTTPFERWLVFYRQPAPGTIELVDLIRGERDLPRRVG
jgi:hypothetical protein